MDERIGLQLDLDGTQQYTAAATAVDKLDTSYRRFGTTQVNTSASMASAGRGFQNFGYSVLYASQLIEDLQYGFRAILNNIPLLVLSMGGGPGLAGAISLVTVGASQLITRWGGLQNLWASNETETEAQRMTRLAKATDEASRKEYELLKAQQERRKAVANMISGASASNADMIAARVADVGGATATDTAYQAMLARENLNKADANQRDPLGLRRKQLRQEATDLIFAITNGTGPQREQAAAALGPAFLGATLNPANRNPGNDLPLQIDETLDSFQEILDEMELADLRFKRGSTTMAMFNERTKELEDAFTALSEKEREVANQAIALADAREKEARANQKAHDDEKRTQAEKQSGGAAGMYAQAFGGGIMQAMRNARMRGEDPTQTDAALRFQLMERMKNLPPGLREIAADQVISQLRGVSDQQFAMHGAGMDIAAAGATAGMAPAGTRLGIMQRQMAARQGFIGAQFAARNAAMLQQAGGMPEAKQLGAAELQLEAARLQRENIEFQRRVLAQGLVL